MPDLLRTAPSKAPARAAAKNVDRRACVLVVDDDEAIQEVTRLALTRYGYETDVVGNGEAAWAALQARPYDLMITDNTMPGMTGWELIIRIRTENLPLPVILASGTAPPDKLAKEQGLLLSAILRKPFTVDELLAATAEALGSRIVEQAPGKAKPPIAMYNSNCKRQS
jgi:CheY-like chemotaxis protein